MIYITRRIKGIIIGSVILLAISLAFNVYMYKANDEMVDNHNTSFLRSKKAFVTSTEEYISALEMYSQKGEFDRETLQTFSTSSLTALNEQFSISLGLYFDAKQSEALDAYQTEYGVFWEAGLTEIADVENQEELKEYIKELKKRFNIYKNKLEQFSDEVD